MQFQIAEQTLSVFVHTYWFFSRIRPTANYYPTTIQLLVVPACLCLWAFCEVKGRLLWSEAGQNRSGGELTLPEELSRNNFSGIDLQPSSALMKDNLDVLWAFQDILQSFFCRTEHHWPTMVAGLITHSLLVPSFACLTCSLSQPCFLPNEHLYLNPCLGVYLWESLN